MHHSRGPRAGARLGVSPLRKNLLWVAKQHGHSIEVMLRMYAAWLDGTTEADIQSIKQAMEKRPAARPALFDSRTAISAINAGTNYPRLIVIRPPESPEFGSSLAVGNGERSNPLNREQIKWRRGWDSNPRTPCGVTRFRGVLLQPLGHLSNLKSRGLK